MYHFLKRNEVIPFFLEREKKGMVLHERTEPETSWHGATLDNAIKRSEIGCESCADLIRKDLINVIRKSSNWGEIYSIPNDVVGSAIDPGALSLGIPECCVTPEITPQHLLGDLGLDIIINAVVSCGVSTNVIRNRGIIACVIALITENLGISSRIIVGMSVKGNSSEGNDFAILLKDYGQPLDIPLLAFWLISPAATRRIGFTLFDSVDKESKYHAHYFPTNTQYKSDRSKQIIIDHGYIREELLTSESAVEATLQTLRKNGVIK